MKVTDLNREKRGKRDCQTELKTNSKGILFAYRSRAVFGIFNPMGRHWQESHTGRQANCAFDSEGKKRLYITADELYIWE